METSSEYGDRIEEVSLVLVCHCHRIEDPNVNGEAVGVSVALHVRASRLAGQRAARQQLPFPFYTTGTACKY